MLLEDSPHPSLLLPLKESIYYVCMISRLLNHEFESSEYFDLLQLASELFDHSSLHVFTLPDH